MEANFKTCLWHQSFFTSSFAAPMAVPDEDGAVKALLPRLVEEFGQDSGKNRTRPEPWPQVSVGICSQLDKRSGGQTPRAVPWHLMGRCGPEEGNAQTNPILPCTFAASSEGRRDEVLGYVAAS